MTISEERQRDLEPLTIRVYQQISAGFPMAEIDSQFDEIDIDPQAKRWILATGRERYLGYYSFMKTQNEQSARLSVMIGAGLLFVVVMIGLVFGWSSNGKMHGKLILGALAGVCGVLYGIWEWSNAELPGMRNDVTPYRDPD